MGGQLEGLVQAVQGPPVVAGLVGLLPVRPQPLHQLNIPLLGRVLATELTQLRQGLGVKIAVVT